MKEKGIRKMYNYSWNNPNQSWNPNWQNPNWENPNWQNSNWGNPNWQDPNWQNPNWPNPNQNPYGFAPNGAHWYRQITIEEAMDIALQQVPGQVVKVELDSKNGMQVYEVEIITSQGSKYEVEVDVNTGGIVDIDLD